MHRFWLGGAVLASAFLGLSAAVPAQDVKGGRDSPAIATQEFKVLAQKAEEKAATLENEVADQDASPPPKDEKITPKEARTVDPTGQAPMDDAITCLARTIYWEAKGEPKEAMAAIANVVINRLADDSYPRTVCEVVKQGQSARSCQFSWWCDGKADDVEEPEPYKVAVDIARRALNKELPDGTEGALFFHHVGVEPDWAQKFQRTAQIGEHVFYRPSPEKTS